MTSVFISYSRSDITIADYIGNELEKRGAKVFIDYQKLEAGENFIGRIGLEIEKRDVLVLLISPRSVASPWVQAEVAWAFTKRKRIVPALFETASLTDFFFLINLEQVDFTRWSVDRKVDDAIQKLAKSIGLAAKPLRAKRKHRPEAKTKIERHSELADSSESKPNTSSKQETETPSYAESDISELFTRATKIAEKDPEQAVFLYRRVIAIDPNYLNGTAKNFAMKEESRLRPIRLANMLSRAQSAISTGKWEQAVQIANDMLEIEEDNKHAQKILENYQNTRPKLILEKAQLDFNNGRWDLAEQNARDLLKLEPDNKEAIHITEVAPKNKECDQFYKQASLEAKENNWGAVGRYMQHVGEEYPEYGDPAHILAKCPILVSLTDRVHEIRKLNVGSPVNTIAFSPDNSLLASGSSENAIDIWKVSTGEKIKELTGHSGEVRSVVFSPDGNTLASASDDGCVRLWKLTSRRAFAVLKTGPQPEVDPFLRQLGLAGLKMGSKTKPNTLRFSPNGKLLATTFGSETSDGIDKTIAKILAMPRGASSFDVKLRGWDESVNCLSFSPDGKLLILGLENSIVQIRQMPSKKLFLTLKGHGAEVNTIAITLDGKFLASGAKDKTIKLWELASGRETLSMPIQNGSVESLSFSPDGSLLASTSTDGIIKLWEVPSGRELGKLKGHGKFVNSVTFSPDGTLIASGSMDGTVRLWGLG